MHVNPSILANSNKNIYQNAVSRQKLVNDYVVLGQLRNRLYDCTWCSQHTRATTPFLTMLLHYGTGSHHDLAMELLIYISDINYYGQSGLGRLLICEIGHTGLYYKRRVARLNNYYFYHQHD